MAVAEKKVQETRTSSAFDRVGVVSLVGVVYVLGCFGILFKLIPDLWRVLWGGMGLQVGSFASLTFQTLAILAAAVGLILLGARLLGPRHMPGVRAGVFVGLLYFLFVLLMTRWVSIWVEHWIYYDRWFGDSGPLVGIILTAVAGAGFLFLAVRWMLKPGFERFVVRFESQGWFSAHSYKPQQGQKVRKGTIAGLLLLFFAGIWTMWSHKVLERGSPAWEIGIPFTGVIKDIIPNDARAELDKKYPKKDDEKYAKWQEEGVPAYEFRKVIDEFDSSRKVRINTLDDEITVPDEDGNFHTFTRNQLVLRSEMVALKKKLSDTNKERLLDAEEAKKQGKPATEVVVLSAAPPTGRMQLATLTLLPHLRFTLPFLLMALSLWFAWRVVNLPSFADFLIATEAELNKVSWTTRRRLFQDTIVVLTTMVLLAVLLFAMDQIWLHLLSWDRVGVIQQGKQEQQRERNPW